MNGKTIGATRTRHQRVRFAMADPARSPKLGAERDTFAGIRGMAYHPGFKAQAYRIVACVPAGADNAGPQGGPLVLSRTGALNHPAVLRANTGVGVP